MLLTLLFAAQLAAGVAPPVERPAAALDDRLTGRIVAAVRARVGAHAEVIVESVENLNPAVTAIEDVRPAANARLGGRMRFLTLAKAQSGPSRLVPVGEIVASVRVVVEHTHATRGLTRGALLGESDVTAATHELSGVTLRPWPRARAFVGGRTTRDLPADACLEPGAVVLKPAVQSGQDVQAIARAAGVEATATLTATASGAEGAVIRVVNRESRRALRARVIGPGMVEILHD